MILWSLCKVVHVDVSSMSSILGPFSWTCSRLTGVFFQMDCMNQPSLIKTWGVFLCNLAALIPQFLLLHLFDSGEGVVDTYGTLHVGLAGWHSKKCTLWWHYVSRTFLYEHKKPGINETTTWPPKSSKFMKCRPHVLEVPARKRTLMINLPMELFPWKLPNAFVGCLG